MSNKKGFVYKFYVVDNNTPVYVGKTGDIEQRFKLHFSEGHIDKNLLKSVSRIQYAECGTYADAGIVERALIGTLEPEWNTQYTKEGAVTISMDLSFLEWRDYPMGNLLVSNEKRPINNVRKRNHNRSFVSRKVVEKAYKDAVYIRPNSESMDFMYLRKETKTFYHEWLYRAAFTDPDPDINYKEWGEKIIRENEKLDWIFKDLAEEVINWAKEDDVFYDLGSEAALMWNLNRQPDELDKLSADEQEQFYEAWGFLDNDTDLIIKNTIDDSIWNKIVNNPFIIVPDRRKELRKYLKGGI